MALCAHYALCGCVRYALALLFYSYFAAAVPYPSKRFGRALPHSAREPGRAALVGNELHNGSAYGENAPSQDEHALGFG